MRRLATGWAALLLLAAMAAPAGAEQIWSVMTRMGAVGTWAGDCAAAAGPSNWHITYYADSGGTARRHADRGPTEAALKSTIDSAQVLTPTTFLMRIRNDDANWGTTNGMTFDTVIEIDKAGMHTLASSRISDGQQFIKDGKFASNGNPAALFKRCK